MAFVSLVHYTITGDIIVFYFPLITATVELIVLYFSSSFAYFGLVQNASFYKLFAVNRRDAKELSMFQYSRANRITYL